MLTEEELAVRWALHPSGGRSTRPAGAPPVRRAAEELRRTAPSGVAAVGRHLEPLWRLGDVEVVGAREPEAAETLYVLTYQGMGVVGPGPAPAPDEDVQKGGVAG